MNYRHSFHAGNFADLVKHALLLWLLQQMQEDGPLTAIDTHAGAGQYDLTGDGQRSKEAEAGIVKLMQADQRPPLIEALAEQVRALNPDGSVTFYPGSPLLIARHLRPGDRYLGYELNPPVAALLQEALQPYPLATGVLGNGYALALDDARRAAAPLVLIDPPFERPDDYLNAADTARALARQNPAARLAIWTPIKDMETFDGFLRQLSGLKVLACEVRLRPLTNPMKMNGCAMVLINPPEGATAAAGQVCGWVAQTLGDSGARAEVWEAATSR